MTETRYRFRKEKDMKKFFAVILSLLTAFVMCFSLVACDGRAPSGADPDGNDPGGSTPTPTPTPTPGGKDGMTEKTLNAVRRLFDENGFKGTVGFKLSSDGKKATDGVIEQTVIAEKRGNMLRATYDDESGKKDVLFDLDTGYEYNIKETDGKLEVLYSNSILPAGLYDYMQSMFDKLVDGGDVSGGDSVIDYDAATRTVSFRTDGAELVNELLRPLYTTYKSGSVVDLLDGYVEYFTDGAYTFSHTTAAGVISIVDLIKGFVTSTKTMDIGTVLETAKQMGVDIEAMLEQNGIDIIAALASYGVDITEQQLMSRQLGQVVVGAYNAVSEYIANGISPSAQGGDPDAMLDGLIAAALNGAFVADVDGSNAEKVIDDLVELLDALKVKALIDGFAAQAPELVAMIANGVEISKLTADVSVKLDSADKLSELKFAFALAHDYDGDKTGFTFLADNNYAADITFGITEYTVAPQAFEYTFADGYSINTYSAGAIAYGEVTDDIKVFVEFGALDAQASVTGVYSVASDYTMTEIVYGDNVTYDAVTSVITIKSTFYNEFLSTAESGDKLSVELSVDPMLSSTPVYVGVVYLPDEPQALLEYLLELIGNVGVTPVPPAPDQGGESVFAA